MVSSPLPRIPTPLVVGGLVRAALVLAIQLFLAWHAHNDLSSQLRGTPLGSRKAPDVMLVDQHGRTRRSSTAGLPQRSFSSATRIAKTPVRSRWPSSPRPIAAWRPGAVRVEMVTVDPARDDPAAMGRFVASYDPHFVGLTGTIATLKPVWSDFGVEVDARTLRRDPRRIDLSGRRRRSHGRALSARRRAVGSRA